jgi:hypothetical protein
MKEEWRPVKGYEGLYEVSNMGRVRSVDHEVEIVQSKRNYKIHRKGQLLKPQARQHGYLCVQLHGRGGHSTRNFKSLSVHRLVAESFVSNPYDYKEVNHKDEDKTNNRADNLEWCTRQYNTNYGSCQIRRVRKGADNPRSKPVNQYTRDGQFVRKFDSINEVRRFGFSIGNVWKCLKGQYSHAYGFVWRFA